MGNSVTQILADYAVGETFDHLPGEVIRNTKRLILDDLGCALGGYTTAGGKILVDFAREVSGKEEATIIGEGIKVSCVFAGGINAQLAGILDFNETWKTGHIGSAIAQTGISLGERIGSRGSEIINAIVVGYETSTRIAEGVWSPNKMESQFRTTSWPVYGPAITAAKLLNLDSQKIEQTIGIAGGMAPTKANRTIERPSHMIKTGEFWWCWAGITGAFLAWKGFTGIANWLDGDKGYWTMVSDRCNPAAMTNGLGYDYHILNQMHLKPWSICRHMHAGIELALNIIREETVDPDEIEEIIFKCYSVVCSPPFDDPRPIEIWDAVFSVPWGIALAAYGYMPGPDWYSAERFKDEKILNLAKKVRLEPLEESSRSFKEKGLEGVIAEVTLKAQGKVHTKRQEGMKGDPQRPLSDAELKSKFRSLTNRVIGEKQTEKLIEIVDRFEELENIAPLTKLFSREGG